MEEDNLHRHFEVAEHDGIRFIHVAAGLSATVYSAVVEQVRKAATKDDIHSIIVTIPEKFAALNAAPGRYKFEHDVVDGGGQVLTVDYATRSCPREAEREFRCKFIAAMNSVLELNHDSWPVAGEGAVR